MRRHLALLVLAAAVPLALLSAGLVLGQASVRTAMLEQALGDTARALALAVDADLAGIVATVEGAALAGGLAEAGEAPADAFAGVSAALLAAHPTWLSIIRTDAFGHATARQGPPPAAPAPLAATVREAIVKNRVAVSGRLPGPADGDASVTLAVPLRRDGAVEAVIGVTVSTRRWGRLLEGQAVPPGWTGAVVDRAGTVVARTPAAAEPAEPPLADRLRRAAEDGDRLLAVRPSAVSGWSLVYAAPQEVIDGPRRRGLWTVAAAAGTVVLVAAGLAARIGRRFGGPAPAAPGAVDGDPLATQPVVIVPRRTAVAIQDLIDAAVAAARGQAAGADIRIAVRPCAAVIDSDPTLLGGILANLVGGAVRRTPLGDGAGRVLVACRRRGGALRIEVWDTGAGTLRRERAGPGLSAVGRTAALLGHPVAVCSHPGQGSCVSVTVPFATAPPVIAAAPPALPDPRRAPPPARSP